MILRFFGGIDLCYVFRAGCNENEDDCDDLPDCCLMVEENDTDHHCEDFSGCDDEWDDMLFELFDHSIHENLSNCC